MNRDDARGFQKFGDAAGFKKLGDAVVGGPKCQKCGKPVKDPKFKFCFDCDKKMKEGGGEWVRIVTLPGECVFQTFYDDDKKENLKRAIFIEAAEMASKAFMNANISQTSVRNLFHLLKDMANRMRADKKLDFGKARETFYKFHRQVVYNVNRKGERGPLLHPVFKEFVEKQIDTATRSREEFLGFVEYLTSIVARLKAK